MPKLTAPPLPPGPRKALSDELHRLHLRAGWPSVRDMTRAIGGTSVASSSRVHDVFRQPRLPDWGLLDILVSALAGRIRGLDPSVESQRFHGLWEAAAEASDKPDGPTGTPEGLDSAFLHSSRSSAEATRKGVQDAAAAMVLAAPLPQEAAPWQESVHPLRAYVQRRLHGLRSRINSTEVLLDQRLAQTANLNEEDEVSRRRILLKSLRAEVEGVGNEFSLIRISPAGAEHILNLLSGLESRVEELRQFPPGWFEPS
ncbi:hypothetical protein ACF1CG_34865 [Streptomyces sp. NPDC014773]|uniref:hypothetical protein n=1 Tax=Streptomyces sp. NPDC014773 TaxID=3364908 RepID=UPI0036FC4178